MKGQKNKRSLFGKDGWRVADCGTAFSKSDDEMEANAHIIAAAPDLLEALKLAQSAVADFHSGMNTTRPSEETCERNERILGSIRAAIAKAEGRAE
jgi:hypothetical protein